MVDLRWATQDSPQAVLYANGFHSAHARVMPGSSATAKVLACDFLAKVSPAL